jgi:lipoprotein-releasing system ATP-binding protein
VGSNVTLELTSVGKDFKKGPAVIKDISLSVAEGQVAALIGSSGSGKTTILQIAGLLDKPTSGAIIIDGVNCTKMSNKHKTNIRRNFLSFVYQFHFLLQELSVLENVMLPQLIAGKSKTEAIKSSQAIL